MFNLKYNSSQILSFVILVICLIAVYVDLINKVYWMGITIISLGLVKINFKLKNILRNLKNQKKKIKLF